MNFETIRQQLIDKTKQDVAQSVSTDILLIQTLASVDDITTQLNGLSKRLREWHAYSLPELDHAISDHETYARLIATKTYDELTTEFVKGTPMGKKLSEINYVPIQSFAKNITELYQLRQSLLHYLEASMQKHMPNTQALAGTTIAARLLSGAGSLKRLAMLPASTVQLLGAEKALFRHLRSGAKSPKYGHIFSHPLITQARKDEKGKMARSLADKLALCAKLDFFKGDFLAPTYKKELEEKFK